SSIASTSPVLAENRIISPLRLGSPSLGLSKKPGLTLIAKPSKPGIHAVFTSTSPLASGIAIERIGGITTLPEASAANACSTISTAWRSRCTTRRSSDSVRTVTSYGIGAPFEGEVAEVQIAPGDDVGEGGHVDIAAGDDQRDRPAGRL